MYKRLQLNHGYFRNTPTSAGPNSFNKGKMGFVDSQKSWEQQQQALLSKLKDKKDAD